MPENDWEQRLAAMDATEMECVLTELLPALHAEDTDKAYRVLRAWGLEESEV